MSASLKNLVAGGVIEAIHQRTTFTGIFLRDGNKAVAPFAFDFRHDRFGIVRGAVVNANYPAKIRVTQQIIQ